VSPKNVVISINADIIADSPFKGGAPEMEILALPLEVIKGLLISLF
jgi:hypothetical protein